MRPKPLHFSVPHLPKHKTPSGRFSHPYGKTNEHSRWERKRLAQHFLVNPRPVAEMIQAAKKEPAVDVVFEVGPGTGILTKALIREFRKVVAVEKDSRLAASLLDELASAGVKNLELIAGDILKVNIQKLAGGTSYAVIANIPYYITGRFIRMLLEAKHRPLYIILMVQKEVAERILSKPPHMNVLALSVQAFGKPKIVACVSKKEFRPEPKVDSAIIKISGISEKFFTENKISEKMFFALIRAGFSQKRKTLANALAQFFGSKTLAKEKIKKAGIRLNARPQELTQENWLNLLRVK